MSPADRRFLLPSKIDGFLATLSRLYESQKEPHLRELIVNAAVSVHEGWEFDNWDGGTYGHAVTLAVTEKDFIPIIEQIDEIQRRISQDLNKVSNIPNEHFSQVTIELEVAENDSWREETGVYQPRTIAPTVAPEALERIWSGEKVRVFLSHKSSVKVETKEVKKALARCGIAAFVAHEDIEPTEDWQREIERALFSMDALVALLSVDFHDSSWTDQEVGVAIGRGVPLISVRLGMDPYGLMGKTQGVGGCSWTDPQGIATKVFGLLHKRLLDKSKLFDCALSAYSKSGSFDDSAWKVKHLLSVFDSLSTEQVQRVVQACNANSQNWSSFRGIELLLPMLQKWTGEAWLVRSNTLERRAVRPEAESPF